MKRFKERITDYLNRCGMRLGVARRTQRFGSGKMAFHKGDAVVVASGTNGMQGVYQDGSEAADIAHGKGLLYTYDSWEEAERYVEV